MIDAGWWPLDPVGVDARKRFLSDAVGYEFVEIGQVFSLAGWQQLQPRLQEIYAERMKAPVEAAIGAGQPALTGWCGTNAEMGFVIHGYENTGAGPPIVGICARSTGGAVERCTDWPYGVLILGKREIPLATDTADIAALRYAVRLARDEVRLTDAQPWLVGQKGYAFWAALLRNTDEPVRPFHHANVIQHLVWNRTAATAFLREVAGRQRGAAVGPLLDAAKIYEQVVDTAGQMSTRGLGDGEQARRALADDVDALAQLERQAAEAIDMAVTEMTLKREGGKVWIDNVNRFSPGEFASSVHGVQARILETLGEAISYEDLVCYGGFAFRANWHKAGCPSAGHPCCGYMCVGNSQRALPWRSKVFEAFPWGKQRSDEQRQAFEAEACAAIKASIDRGIPVHYGGEEDGLIIGYADEGRRWWCVHPYHKGGGEPFWHDEAGGFAGSNRGWPWGIVVWTEPKSVDERSTDRDLTLGALRQAVDMWQTEIRGDYFCGDAAYAQWVAWLRGIDAGEVTDPKAGMQGNGWCYDVLVHSRRIAAPWLERKAELFDGEAREQLLTAASAYERIPGICLKGATCPWDIAPGPSSFDDWSAEMRSEQVRRLEEARECDRAAIAAIGRALAVMEDAP